MEKEGFHRVHVKLIQSWADHKMIWYVVAVVIFENDRPVVDDIVYLKQDDVNEYRLSEILKEDCKDQ